MSWQYNVVNLSVGDENEPTTWDIRFTECNQGIVSTRCISVFLVSLCNTSTTMNMVLMMTSSNGNIVRVTGPLCGEFTGHRMECRFDLIPYKFIVSNICLWRFHSYAISLYHVQITYLWWSAWILAVLFLINTSQFHLSLNITWKLKAHFIQSVYGWVTITLLLFLSKRLD